jgi:hypothetical protein
VSLEVGPAAADLITAFGDHRVPRSCLLRKAYAATIAPSTCL